MSKIKDKISDLKWSEHRVMHGLQNGDKCFYVIRRKSKTVGLFSYVLTALGHIKLAEDKGYIPVIDMKNYMSPYLDLQDRSNVWEYYFEQPMGYSLEDIKNSRNILLSSGDGPNYYPDFSMFTDENQIKYWRKKYHQYIRLNEETQNYIEKQYKVLFGNEKVCGVLCRGTDYRELKPKEHPIQPEVDDVIIKVRQIMDERQCTRIYLATEDQGILTRFRNAFGDKLIFPDMVMRPYKRGDFITEVEVDRKDDKKLKGLEYLTQIALLSKCNCFVGSGCGGSYGALLMSDGFEWEYRWNLGVY